MSRPTDYGKSFADVYDAWYADLSDPTAMVDAVCAAMSGSEGTRLLELGVGTGRLAVPLGQAGLAVTGIDASVPMLRQWQAKAAMATEPNPFAVGGDMAALPFADHTFGGALIAYNTFFNLDDEEQQHRCLNELNRVVQPDGFVALEAFVPAPPPAEDDQRVVPASRSGVFIATRQRRGSQLVEGAHITFEDDGVRTRPWCIRPVSPVELDAMATAAGLSLDRRTQTWEGQQFDAESDTHVSWYRSVS